jgi:hypothetical protein
MNFSSLSSNEKLAAYGAIAAIVGTLLTVVSGAGGLAGGLWLTLLLGVVMLAIVFMPQWSPQTSLPGSKGSLMLVVGGIAALGAVLGLLTLLTWFRFLGDAPLFIIGLLLGIVGGAVMGWAAWQEFQAEGGKFQLGSTAGAGGTGGSSGTGSTAAASSSAGQSPGVSGGSAADRGIGTEGGMGTGASAMPHGGASSGGTTGEPTAATTQGMGSTGSPATAAGSTSAGSTDMGGGGTSPGTGSDEGTTRNP